MHVLLVTPYYAPEWQFGGPPRKIAGLAQALLARGQVVDVVTFDSRNRKNCSKVCVNGVSCQYLPWFGNGLRQCPSGLGALKSAIESADVLHCFGLYNSICPLAAWLAHRAGKPFVIEPMGMFVPRNRSVILKHLYHFIVTRWLFSKAAAAIATSDLEANELRTHLSAEKLFIRPNGVELEKVPALDRNEERHKRGISDDEKLIGYLGRISRKKQLTNLVSAFELLDAMKTKLLIAGPVTETGYWDELHQAIDSSARRRDIIVDGALEGQRYVATLGSLDLFVLPSENENFGNAAGEAVLAGVPVLLTRDCGVAPMIDGRVGLAVEQGVQALASGMRTMLQPEARLRWEPNWSQVQAEFSWDEPVRTQERIYERILEKNGKLKAEN